MPERGGWELVDVVGAQPPGLPIILYASNLDVGTAVQLMKSGVSDILPYPVPEDALRSGIQRCMEIDLRLKREFAARGAARRHFATLTPREREVFGLVVSGLPSKDIARLLDRSLKTVEVHRTSIMRKMAARSVVDLVRLGLTLHVDEGGDANGERIPVR
jgi:FixJ family two-component response regulator